MPGTDALLMGSEAVRGQRPLFDTEVVVVERLLALMHFDIDVGVVVLEPGFDKRRAGFGGVVASDQRQELVVLGEQ